MGEANTVLQRYLPRFNKRFMKAAAQPGSAFRPALSRAEANAHTISLFGHVLALPELPVRTNLAGRRVALHHRMDGRLAVIYQEQVLGMFQPVRLGPPRLEAFEPAPHHLLPPQTHPLRLPAAADPAGNGSGSSHVSPPKVEHPWRKQNRLSWERRQQQQQKESR